MNKTLLNEYNQYIIKNFSIDVDKLNRLKDTFIDDKKTIKQNLKYPRPRGRGKKNMVWDGNNGLWVDENNKAIIPP